MNLRYHSSKVQFFIRFLGELKMPKRHFEINWPFRFPVFENPGRNIWMAVAIYVSTFKTGATYCVTSVLFLCPTKNNGKKSYVGVLCRTPFLYWLHNSWRDPIIVGHTRILSHDLKCVPNYRFFSKWKKNNLKMPF